MAYIKIKFTYCDFQIDDFKGCDLYLIKLYCVSVLAFSNAVHNFWRDSIKAMLGNVLIVLKEYQEEVAPLQISDRDYVCTLQDPPRHY